MKDETYYFHQTPNDLAKDLINMLNLDSNDTFLEPFRGQGAFYDNLPINKYYTEIEEGLDYKTFENPVDWVITNPPFAFNDLDINGKRVNAYYPLLDYYTSESRVRKGIGFLGNEKCLSTLTPKRMKTFNDRGWYIHKVIICSIKKWRGRYFFIVFKKEFNGTFLYLNGSY